MIFDELAKLLVLKLRVRGSRHSADNIGANLIAHRLRTGKLLVIAQEFNPAKNEKKVSLTSSVILAAAESDGGAERAAAEAGGF